MENLVRGMNFTAPAIKELRALQSEQTFIKLKILLDVRFQCKLCTERNEEDRLSPEWSDCTKRWVELQHIKEHLRSDHDDFRGEEAAFDNAAPVNKPGGKFTTVSDPTTDKETPVRRSNRVKKRKQNLSSSMKKLMLDDCAESISVKKENSRLKRAQQNADSDTQDTCSDTALEEFVESSAVAVDSKESASTLPDLSCDELIARLMIDADKVDQNDMHIIKIEPTEDRIIPSEDTERKQFSSHKAIGEDNDLGSNVKKVKSPRKYKRKSKHSTVSKEIFEPKCSGAGEDHALEQADGSLNKKESSRYLKARTCPGCNSVFENSGECLRHYMEKHDSLKKFGEVAPILTAESQATSEAKKAHCPLCKKTFPMWSFLNHIMLIHVWRPVTRRKTRKKEHLCSLCGKVFQYDQNYYSHVRVVHNGHKRKHSPYKAKQFKCVLCDYTTCEQRRLGNHMKYVHSGIKAYSCQHCSYSTWERTSMRDHVYRHLETKRYSCELCSYQCIQRKQLRGHMMHKHHVDLPKRGKTRLPAKSGPRHTVKPVIELTNRAVSTDPVRPRKTTKKASKSSQDSNQSKRPKLSTPSQDNPTKVTAPGSNVDLSNALNQIQPDQSWTMIMGKTNEPIHPVPTSSMSYAMNNPYQTCPEATAKQNQEQFRVLSNIPCSTSSSSFVQMTTAPLQETRTSNFGEIASTTASNFIVLPTLNTNIMDNRTMLPSGDQYQIVAQEAMEPSVGQFSQQGANIRYQTQPVLPQKTGYQLVPLEQPMTVVSNNAAEIDILKNKMANPQFSTVQTSPIFSGVKAHTPLGEAIAVTPIYAQTPEASNSLTPSNSRFVYIIK